MSGCQGPPAGRGCPGAPGWAVPSAQQQARCWQGQCTPLAAQGISRELRDLAERRACAGDQEPPPHPCSGSRPAQSPPEQSQDAKSLSARPSSNARRQRARPGIGQGGSRGDVLVWGQSSLTAHLAPTCITLPRPSTRPMAKPPAGGDTGHVCPCHHLCLTAAACERGQDSWLQPAHPAGMPAMWSRQAPFVPHSSEPKK